MSALGLYEFQTVDARHARKPVPAVPIGGNIAVFDAALPERDADDLIALYAEEGVRDLQREDGRLCAARNGIDERARTCVGAAEVIHADGAVRTQVEAVVGRIPAAVARAEPRIEVEFYRARKCSLAHKAEEERRLPSRDIGSEGSKYIRFRAEGAAELRIFAGEIDIPERERLTIRIVGGGEGNFRREIPVERDGDLGVYHGEVFDGEGTVLPRRRRQVARGDDRTLEPRPLDADDFAAERDVHDLGGRGDRFVDDQRIRRRELLCRARLAAFGIALLGEGDGHADEGRDAREGVDALFVRRSGARFAAIGQGDRDAIDRIFLPCAAT